jgi:hypothetical protein
VDSALSIKQFVFAEPAIAADAKGHGTYAKAPWVALLKLSRLLNSSLNEI